MAVEEALDASTRSTTIPLLRRNSPSRVYWHKLGHPALVQDDGGFGCIGGELSFSDGVWLLKNRSGRYGMFCGRESKQLDNVAMRLCLYGLQVQPDFIG